MSHFLDFLNIVSGFSQRLSVITLSTAGFTALSCEAFQAVRQFPELIMQGGSYPCACDSEEQTALHATLLRSNAKNSAEAWRAVQAILCSPSNHAGRSYIAGLVRKTVRESSESTGSREVVKKVARSGGLIEDIMAKGRAWNVRLRTEPNKIYLQYFENEACVREIILSFADRKWFIEEIGQACD